MGFKYNSIKHILIVSEQYPTLSDPVYAFVGQIANAFAKLNVAVTVIAPQSLSKHFLRNVPLHERYYEINNACGKNIVVFQPYYISFGNHFSKLNRFLFYMACCSAFRKIKEKPDVCYGHFWRCAYTAFGIAKKNNLPLFIASGESKIKKMSDYSKKNEFLDYYNGVIFVSQKNRNESISLGYLTNQKHIVLPNAVDPLKFFRKDKLSLREKYGIAQNVFVVAFVGAFINRKGPQRVADALNSLGIPQIKAFFIGCEKDGVACPFDYEGILFKGVVPHEKLVDYLNMADVFVLPTLAEGCCNAIVEAMACGLPIVSSNLDFNDDILDEYSSIRINPMSIAEIADAVKMLYVNQELRLNLSKGALAKAKSLTIDNRVNAILEFMNDCIERSH